MSGKKIVIVGGGTAAWISAILIREADPTADITVIYSRTIGTVGVGESTTPMFYNFINKWTSLIDEKDFLLKTGATLKLGVVHQGWTDSSSVFFNPIDSVDHQSSNAHPYDFDSLRAYCVSEGIPLDINYESICIKKGIVPFELKDNYLVKKANYAYHLDVDKTIEYLKTICIQNNIKIIQDTVVDIKTNYKVEEVILQTGGRIPGELFIDCSGMSSLFLNFRNEWIERKASILDTAVLYEEPSDSTRTYTLAKGTRDGWEWKIPHKGKRNCGYLFNSSLTCSTCIQEKLNSDKLIKFKSGRVFKFLNKNVLHLGLSSGFVEPLEATSLHLTLVQLKIFLGKYYRSDITYPNLVYEKDYNTHIGTLWDSTFDWIKLHYFNTRQDSKFWIENSKLEPSSRLKELIETYRHRMPRFTDYSSREIYQLALTYHILDGMKLLDPNIAQKELHHYNLLDTGKHQYQQLMDDNLRFSSRFVSHDYLLNNIFDIY